MNGTQYRMTNTGRIGMLTNYNHTWIGDGAWPLIRSAIGGDGRLIHATYNVQRHEVWFMFQKIGVDFGVETRGLVIVCLPRPEHGIRDQDRKAIVKYFRYYPHSLSNPLF